MVSSYSLDADGWYVLSTTSYLARGGIAILLLTPITMLMGGTLTLLIRHLVRSDLEIGGWRIALLYGVNTVGAALGCFLTDSWLVPAAGLQAAQAVAVFFNFVAAAGALLLASGARGTPVAITVKPVLARSSNVRSAAAPTPAVSALGWTSFALGLSGFAAMGMEIVWFRHFTLLLGTFRAVYSLLFTVILIGIGAGVSRRRFPAPPYGATWPVADRCARTLRCFNIARAGRRRCTRPYGHRPGGPTHARREIRRGAKCRGAMVQCTADPP